MCSGRGLLVFVAPVNMKEGGTIVIDLSPIDFGITCLMSPLHVLIRNG